MCSSDLSAIALAVGALDDVLEIRDVHGSTVDGSASGTERLRQLGPDTGVVVSVIRSFTPCKGGFSAQGADFCHYD